MLPHTTHTMPSLKHSLFATVAVFVCLAVR